MSFSDPFPLDDTSVLVTGGTGAFGRSLVAELLARHRPARVVVFSRDEYKQAEMSRERRFRNPALRFVLGDVRDKQTLLHALRDVDVVVHAAALKQVPTCEDNPFETIRTNVLGAQNVIEAAIERRVARVVALSTDKACNPSSVYGATKLCADKVFVAANRDAHRALPGAADATRFAVVRYGNFVGGRGGVIPLLTELRETGKLPITHPEMTRFWIPLERAVDFLLGCLERMRGGELFVPKLPSMRVVELARVIGPECELEVVGVRPGEKIHEELISEHDARNTLEFDDHFLVQPEFDGWPSGIRSQAPGRPVAPTFRYRSDLNDEWLDAEELRELLARMLPANS